MKWLPNPETNSIYLGDTIGGTFVAGGGGWLVSKKVLKELSKNIHQCLHKQQHATGKWCWYHSDWAIGECIFEFTNTIPVHSNHFIHIVSMQPETPKDQHQRSTLKEEKKLAKHVREKHQKVA